MLSDRLFLDSEVRGSYHHEQAILQRRREEFTGEMARRRSSAGGLAGLLLLLLVLGLAVETLRALWPVILALAAVGIIVVVMSKVDQYYRTRTPALDPDISALLELEQRQREIDAQLKNLGILPDFATMDPVSFEHLMCDLCKAMGLEADNVGKSGDGGVDIVAHNKSPIVGGTYIVQCKRYAGKVPVEMVRALYGVLTDRRANKAVLITTGDFTAPAREFARGKPLELIDGVKLQELLGQYKLAQP